jgi:hypothetical protein
MNSFLHSINRSRARNLLKAAILTIFLLGNFLNLQAGWADNADYIRIMQWFTSGPAHMENWPPERSPLWNQRFSHYWIPDWKLDFPGKPQMFISSVLLWAPGVFLNRYFYSAYTLHLPIMSIGPRLMLLLFLCLVFKWIDARSKHPEIHYAALGLPLALLFSTTDVVAFFNSFYQETGSIVFVPFLLAVVVYGHFKPRDWKFYLAYFVTILLVCMSKSASFYWSFLTLPLVLSAAQVRKKPAVYLPLGLALIIVPLLVGMKLTHYATALPMREYNSLFGGTLLLSNNPQQRLNELGLSEASQCIGAEPYLPEGLACLKTFSGRFSYLSVLHSMLSEPAIIARQVDEIIYTAQNYSLQLGKYVYQDDVKRQEARLNLWSEIKQRFFPRGWALLATFPVFGYIIWISRRQEGLTGDLAPDALVCALAFWLDSFVEIWGDGPRDLLKHLFMPNMFFDFLLIAIINMTIGLVIYRFSSKPALKASTFSKLIR